MEGRELRVELAERNGGEGGREEPSLSPGEASELLAVLVARRAPLVGCERLRHVLSARGVERRGEDGS